MLEAASAGAKVLHNRSVNMGKRHEIPIYVKNSQDSSKTGSKVCKLSKDDVNEKENTEDENFEDYEIKFITKKDDISKISIIGDMVMSNKEAIIKIFNIAYIENITIYMISFSEIAISIIIDKDKSQIFMEKLHRDLIENNN